MQSQNNYPQKKFLLLKKVAAPRREEQITILPPITEHPSKSPILESILNNRTHHLEPLALDLETRGFPLDKQLVNGKWEYSSAPVGIGLSDNRGSWYIDLTASHPATYSWLAWELHRLQIPLIAHNVNFDATWFVRDFGLWLNWQACTYALYRLCATEGWPGQKWGLKDAQVELLGWKDTNEQELDDWLVDNGYGDKYVESTTGKVIKRPDKGEMWRAPPNILGKYCALDASSTYQLYTLVLKPCLDRFKALRIYGTEMYMQYSSMLIAQTLTGIRVDRKRLEKHAKDTQDALEEAVRSIFQHSVLRPWLDRFNQDAVLEVASKEPSRYTTVKERPKEPDRFKKNGEVSKNWLTWVKNEHLYVPAISKNWLKWQEKYQAALRQEHFNLKSYPQKKRLFYDYLYPNSHKDILTRKIGEREITEEVFRLITPSREVCLPLTGTGGVPVDRKAIRQMEDVGRVFLEYSDLLKEQQFIDALLENSKTGRLHPQFRVPGTLSGRLSGGSARRKNKETGEWIRGFNIQQIPKSPGFLRCFIPDEGKVFVDCDVVALEQVVLAELSKDATLWKLYGPHGFKHQDVYLYNGANLPSIGEKIRASGYDPENPTLENITEAKIKCKKERMLAKLVTLGASYKMGPAKLQRTLELEGIKVTFEEAKEIHRGYWNLYAGVKKYEYKLVDQYEDNQGWILNGVGRPISIFESYKSDIVNRVIQSTGHDLHVKNILITSEVLKENNIPFDWVVADFHDQLIVQVWKKDADKVKGLLAGECYRRLNGWAGGQIPLKGDAQIVRDLSYAKVSKEDIKQYLKDLGIIDEEEQPEEN